MKWDAHFSFRLAGGKRENGCPCVAPTKAHDVSEPLTSVCAKGGDALPLPFRIPDDGIHLFLREGLALHWLFLGQFDSLQPLADVVGKQVLGPSVAEGGGKQRQLVVGGSGANLRASRDGEGGQVTLCELAQGVVGTGAKEGKKLLHDLTVFVRCSECTPRRFVFAPLVQVVADRKCGSRGASCFPEGIGHDSLNLCRGQLPPRGSLQVCRDLLRLSLVGLLR